MIHVVFGATGLIGNELIRLIPETDTLITIGRRAIAPLHSRHQHFLSTLESESLNSIEPGLIPDVVYVCLGTTIKVAGSREEFYRIDHDLVLNAALFANRLQSKKLIVVSAIGSDPESSIFYSRVKGEMERDVEKMTPAVSQVIFVRPSLLIGDRSGLKQKPRLAEKISILLTPLYAGLMIGSLRRYKPVSAKQVASKLLSVTRSNHSSKRLVVIPNETIFE